METLDMGGIEFLVCVIFSRPIDAEIIERNSNR